MVILWIPSKIIFLPLSLNSSILHHFHLELEINYQNLDLGSQLKDVLLDLFEIQIKKLNRQQTMLYCFFHPDVRSFPFRPRATSDQCRVLPWFEGGVGVVPLLEAEFCPLLDLGVSDGCFKVHISSISILKVFLGDFIL